MRTAPINNAAGIAPWAKVNGRDAAATSGAHRTNAKLPRECVMNCSLVILGNVRLVAYNLKLSDGEAGRWSA
jgi:hypothetical protein